MKVWVVLPAYNEEEALPPLLTSLVETLKEERQDFSIIVVDDGSTDGTGKLIDELSARIPVIPLHNRPNQGLAETIKVGLTAAVERAAPADVIITMDADNTHPAGLMLRMLRLIREGNDVVIASRYREGSHVRGLSAFRRFLSLVASWLFRVVFPMRGVRDYTCGYRAYRAASIKALVDKYHRQFITERGFSCMVDILLRLRQEDLIFSEVPLVLRYDQKPGVTKMKIAQTVTDTLKLLVRRRLGMS
ncbi:MAG: glycosyltransferase family 2 protein [Bdellovibrionota bacterium]